MVDDAFAARTTAGIAGTLAGVNRLGVAFSGGVDSSVLLALAARALGRERVIAILGVSASLAADERSAAHDVARHIGVPVVEVVTHEGDRPEYQANGPDRCFHCRDELFTRIDDTVTALHRLDAIAYGENTDDARRPDRPGARAATNHRVLRPLVTLGLDKASVRRIARSFGLPSADKPAAPCLASRIPHFSEVTPRKLGQIERAEAALRGLGFHDLRVRHHDEVARLELTPADMVRAVTDPVRREVHAAITAAGFRFVALDLAGVQSGAFTLPLVTISPTGSPTGSPTISPTGSPIGSPTISPTGSPTISPTGSPIGSPTGATLGAATDTTAGPTAGRTASATAETTANATAEATPSATAEATPDTTAGTTVDATAGELPPRRSPVSEPSFPDPPPRFPVSSERRSHSDTRFPELGRD
ncbi:asparagine synthase-related protein [Actinoplanes sp. N902-109]|uniref:asparagine synthase-related protein n=1 Tax=Actinoplanes sp. (strain N902-109) TaxID=649831 RepID=UPI00032950EB|nr:asparagine synthase-related protein [Actinoplanes sp. N902-109]AGL19857.1 hypothetical protein L083_6347 [Actinoplanes sp. N902-109]